MPKDITDKNGKALLSSRVAILPYIEQDPLYKQFKLNEAWDSDNNKKLLEKMPTTYAPPLGKFAKGQTLYQSFSGPGALMGGKPVKFQNITDGTSNTFMVIEAGDAVDWSKPADVAFDAKKPLPKLGGIFDGAFNVAMCDGSVRFVAKGVNSENLKKYITLAGAELPGDSDSIRRSRLNSAVCGTDGGAGGLSHKPNSFTAEAVSREPTCELTIDASSMSATRSPSACCVRLSRVTCICRGTGRQEAQHVPRISASLGLGTSALHASITSRHMTVNFRAISRPKRQTAA